MRRSAQRSNQWCVPRGTRIRSPASTSIAKTAPSRGWTWNRPRPSMMNRTSSSSCQCSRLNFASMTSMLGVSGFTSIKEAVDAGMIPEQAPHLDRETIHVLIIFEHGQPFDVLVGRDTGQPLQHFIATDGDAAAISEALGQNRAPDRMRVEDGCRAARVYE